MENREGYFRKPTLHLRANYQDVSSFGLRTNYIEMSEKSDCLLLTLNISRLTSGDERRRRMHSSGDRLRNTL